MPQSGLARKMAREMAPASDGFEAAAEIGKGFARQALRALRFTTRHATALENNSLVRLIAGKGKL